MVNMTNVCKVILIATANDVLYEFWEKLKVCWSENLRGKGRKWDMLFYLKILQNMPPF